MLTIRRCLAGGEHHNTYHNTYHDDFCRRGARVAGETSMPSATTRPTTGQSVQWPPNQFCTAAYQRSVVGRNTKPRTGQRMVAEMPRNQLVANQSTSTT